MTESETPLVVELNCETGEVIERPETPDETFERETQEQALVEERQRQEAEAAAQEAQRQADAQAVLNSPLLVNDPAGRAALARLLGLPTE